MCGIAVFVNLDVSIHPAAAAIQHRGPDGVLVERLENGRVQLAHSLLATLDDPDVSRQPMWDAERRVCIVFNGFLSNLAEMRDLLAHDGYHCRTRTDTEAIAELFARRGDAAFELFDGMFVILAYDTRTRAISYARDAAGIKPLFIRRIGDGYALASEIPALRVLGPVTPDEAAIVDAVVLNYVPGIRTGTVEVERVAPGGRGRIHADGKHVVLPPLTFAEKCDARDAGWETLWGTLRDSVETHAESNRPIAVAFSSGTDSTSLASLLRGRDVTLISIVSPDRVPGDKLDDPEPMQAMAKLLGHRWECVEAPVMTVDALRSIGQAMAEPFADSAALATDVIAKATAALGLRVLLSGHGSDELFGGYRRALAAHYILPFLPQLKLRQVPTRDGERFRILAALPPADRIALLGCWLAPDRLGRVFAPGVVSSTGGANGLVNRLRPIQRPGDSLLRQSLHTDQEVCLPDQMLSYADRFTMRNGVENRVPFLTHKMVSLSRGMASTELVRNLTGKYALKRALRHEIGDKAFNRHVKGKRGLGVSFATILRRQGQQIADMLFASDSDSRHLWNPALEGAIRTGDKNLDSYHLGAMLMIDGWLSSLRN